MNSFQPSRYDKIKYQVQTIWAQAKRGGHARTENNRPAWEKDAWEAFKQQNIKLAQEAVGLPGYTTLIKAYLRLVQVVAVSFIKDQ